MATLKKLKTCYCNGILSDIVPGIMDTVERVAAYTPPLEGRFESFTVGSATEWEKVREIYRMGLKHGMKLAAISGVAGVFSDDDIFKVKELALKEIKKAKKNPL